MTKVVIELEIETCRECPYFQSANPCTNEGGHFMDDWICSKSDKKISGSVPWYEEGGIEIPDWCPIKID